MERRRPHRPEPPGSHMAAAEVSELLLLALLLCNSQVWY
jgi:hypothetical protein